MKVIIAGSRNVDNYMLIEAAVLQSDFYTEITEVVSGGAKGADRLGELYARNNNIEVKTFIPDWNDIDAPGAVVKKNRWGKKYNSKAGFDRNEKMGEYADALIAIWDGKSAGTKSMINIMKRLDKPCYVAIVNV